MKQLIFSSLFGLITSLSYSQTDALSFQQQNIITSLINKYAEAREKKDTVLLKTILTEDIDQLVSTGEWRNGISTAVQGMLKSSTTNSGTRILHVEKIRILNGNCAVVDCRYEIQNADNSLRKMWSTFIVVEDKDVWKIAAIRNMLPAAQ